MSDGKAAQASIAEPTTGVEGHGQPEPLLPDWEGACLHHVVPTLLGHLAHPGEALPPWFPAPVADARQIVLLVLDGLGAEQLRERRELAPVLTTATGGSITSVAPSTTACALTSLVTGRVPAEHGVVGYRVALDGEVMNVLQWSVNGADARLRVPAPVFQPFESFPGSDGLVPVVTRHDYGPTGFTAAHLGRVELHRWHTPAGLVTAVRELVAGGAPFVYAYYEGIDKVAHARGTRSVLRRRAASRRPSRRRRPRGAPARSRLGRHRRPRPGRGRRVRRGARPRDHAGRDPHQRRRPVSLAACPAGCRQRRWRRPRPHCTATWPGCGPRSRSSGRAGWAGCRPRAVSARLGDVALVPFAPTAFLDPADTGELRLKARHGSLTPAEMLIPLLSWPAS